ncbi:MAG: class I adenylate-forming enzyme family protein [Rhodococcus fascians]
MLPDLLRSAADRFGDADYVITSGRRLTFLGAERASARLAKHMIGAGIGKGTRVAIVLPTGVEWVIAWLAAARVGAFPMLIPATYRPGELRRALRISDASVLIAPQRMFDKDYEHALEQAIPGLRGRTGRLLFDADVPFLREVWVHPTSTRPWATPTDVTGPGLDPKVTDELLVAIESEVSPADPLLVIFTSGTTADPKAIVHSHGAAIRKVQPELGVCLPGSLPGRTFCAMPFFWVGGPQNLLGALHSGSAIVAQERFDAREALDLLESERCTSMIGWASMYDKIFSDPSAAHRDLSALQMPDPLPRSSRGHQRNLGMTETFGPHANPDWFDYRIIDPSNGCVQPDGIEGEFCVRGFGLMAGMYKRERETVIDGEGWYHTGDHGYIEAGHVWFTGRSGDMIKRAGANVSPLEVEQALANCADVATAIVIGLPVSDDDEVVGAVIVRTNGRCPIPDRLSAELATELSGYKIPQHWLVLSDDELPLLASGKPDKRKLRERLLSTTEQEPSAAATTGTANGDTSQREV